jgi:Asp-tRNA(Asn)/Glu-tRNA(Gln) amidotransferase A subunit family amidase
MRMSASVFLPITELSRRIDAGALDPLTLTSAFLERFDGVGRALNCYVALCRDQALADAEQASERAARKQRLSSLDGIPIAIKDNIDVAGVPTTNGFGGRHHPVPLADAEVIRRLRVAGGVILGKLNMQEGALGAVNDNAHHGRTTNPFREGYTPGARAGVLGRRLLLDFAREHLGRTPGARCASPPPIAVWWD